MRRKILLIAVVLAIALQAMSMMPAALAETGNSFTILLLGVDSANETAEEAGNADAFILASLDMKTGTFKMINIQRDTLVELPDGLGAGRLCTATSRGGPQMALKTVNSLLALDTSYYVQVDMAGMEKIVDALDGLEVDVPASELNMLLPDGKTKVFKKSGMQTLSTEQVMAYIKSPAVAEGTNRSERLGKVLNACLKKGMNLDLGSLLNLVSELLEYVETNMTLNDMMNLAFSALSVDLAGIETTRFPQKAKQETRDLSTVAVMEDWGEEILAVHTFLYGASSPLQSAQP